MRTLQHQMPLGTEIQSTILATRAGNTDQIAVKARLASDRHVGQSVDVSTDGTAGKIQIDGTVRIHVDGISTTLEQPPALMDIQSSLGTVHMNTTGLTLDSAAVVQATFDSDFFTDQDRRRILAVSNNAATVDQFAFNIGRDIRLIYGHSSTRVVIKETVTFLQRDTNRIDMIVSATVHINTSGVFQVTTDVGPVNHETRNIHVKVRIAHPPIGSGNLTLVTHTTGNTHLVQLQHLSIRTAGRQHSLVDQISFDQAIFNHHHFRRHELFRPGSSDSGIQNQIALEGRIFDLEYLTGSSETTCYRHRT